MFAVIKTGGKQYKVAEGDTITVEKLDTEAGKDVTFETVLMLGNGDGPTVHHPMYNFNDDAIPAGCSWFAEMIETRLPA